MKNLCVLCVVLLGLAVASPAGAQPLFNVTNLVTDNQSVNAAVISDSTATNSWGISLSATSPFWVAAEGTQSANVYTVTSTGSVTNISKNAIHVTIPGAGNVTGTVNNSNTAAFKPSGTSDSFLFVSQDGTVSGWRGGLGTTGTAEVLAAASTANAYFGCTEVTSGTDSYLYAANFKAGAINVFPGAATSPSRTGSFTDPSLPAGYAPYNIQNLAGNLFVTYALQNSAGTAAVIGAGNGFVDEYDAQGNFLERVASQGSLDAPWGLAIAPSTFGSYAGDLLVGNFGGGAINVFSLSGTPSFVGQLDGPSDTPLSIPGLWALQPGNGGNGGNPGNVYFTAGPNNQADGLFGVISPVPEPSTLALIASGATGLLIYRWRRRHGRINCS